MPRPSQKRTPSRPQVDIRDTFDYTTPKLQPRARPVDAMVAPVERNDGARLLQALDSFDRGMRTGVGIKKRYDDKEYEKGQMSRMKGDERPNEASDAFLNGWLNFDGKATAFDLERDLFELYQNSYEMSAGEWTAAKNEIVEQYVSGRSDEWAKGFVPTAMAREEAYDKKFLQRQQQQLKLKSATKVRQIADVQVRAIVESETEDQDGLIREVLSDLQEQAGQFGLTRTEISANFVEEVGEMAVEAGRPDWLNFAEVTDSDGVSLSMNPELSSDINTIQKQAEARRDSIIREVEQAKKERRVEIQKEVERGVIDAMSTNSWDVAEKTLLKYRKFISPTRYEHYRKTINDFRTGDGFFRKNSVMDVFEDLQLGLITGKYGLRDLREHKSYLSRKDYRTLFKEVANQTEDQIKTLKGGSSKDDSMDFFEDQLKPAIRNVRNEILHPGDIVAQMDREGLKQRVTKVETTMRLLGRQWMAEHKGQDISRAEMTDAIFQIREDAVRLSALEFPELRQALTGKMSYEDQRRKEMERTFGNNEDTGSPEWGAIMGSVESEIETSEEDDYEWMNYENDSLSNSPLRQMTTAPSID